MLLSDILSLENITLTPLLNISKKDKRKASAKNRRCQNKDNYPVAHESATISAFAGSYRKSVRFAVSIPVAKQPPKVTIYLYSLYQ